VGGFLSGHIALGFPKTLTNTGHLEDWKSRSDFITADMVPGTMLMTHTVDRPPNAPEKTRLHLSWDSSGDKQDTTTELIPKFKWIRTNSDICYTQGGKKVITSDSC